MEYLIKFLERILGPEWIGTIETDMEPQFFEASPDIQKAITQAVETSQDIKAAGRSSTPPKTDNLFALTESTRQIINILFKNMLLSLSEALGETVTDDEKSQLANTLHEQFGALEEMNLSVFQAFMSDKEAKQLKSLSPTLSEEVSSVYDHARKALSVSGGKNVYEIFANDKQHQKLVDHITSIDENNNNPEASRNAVRLALMSSIMQISYEVLSKTLQTYIDAGQQNDKPQGRGN